mmetsp:Transcript_8310/g.13891  ORF Transcript_8310/g.13891 Transcript_8310/m.13891 type:complete len:181 (+) Transcript_8310:71-613(+)
MSKSILLATLACSLVQGQQFDSTEIKQVIEESKLTCSSSVRLQNVNNLYFLFSNSMGYGGGSGQQIVTCHNQPYLNGELWTFKEQDLSDQQLSPSELDQKTCLTGKVLRCGDTIRLEHMETAKNLHSHEVKSPISSQNEVSGYGDDGEGDSGDNWKIECLDQTTNLPLKGEQEVDGKTQF